MTRLTKAATAAAVLTLVGAPAAQAHARVHCKRGYVAHIVKHRRHHRVVRRVHCVKVRTHTAPKRVVPPPVERHVVLHAHLDPSFTRNPANPFQVTYAFSASATAEARIASTEPTPLPEGVLSLYNDGLLACSINVGGSTTEGHCPVTYAALGRHTVTTIYSSGPTSATETDVENVEPLKVTLNLSISGEAFSPAHAECEGPGECNRFMLGRITVSGAALGEAGPPNGKVNVIVRAPVCSWAEYTYGCNQGSEAEEAMSIYEWTTLKPGTEEPEAVGLTSNPTLPAANSPQWSTLLENPLTLTGLMSEAYVTEAVFTAPGYAATEVKSPLLVPPA